MAKTLRPNLAESLVVTSLIIKVVQLVGEQTVLKAQFPRPFEVASTLSLLLFGLSLLLWLNSSRKDLEKVEAMAQRVEEIKRELDDVDRIARYGRGPVHLASLLRSQGFLHGQAGGETLAEVFLNTYAAVAEDLYALTQGLKDRVEFVEYHVVDKFLLNLMRNLPAGSIWLGTTRLQNQSAWEKGNAEPTYFEFQELVEQRTRQQEIHYFRLWCFDSTAGRSDLGKIVRAQSDAGLCQRTCVDVTIPDMSLIWVPQNTSGVAVKPNFSQESIARVISSPSYRPLCGIEFRARGGKELDAMTLHAPRTDDFTRLRQQFLQKWHVADTVGSDLKSA